MVRCFCLQAEDEEDEDGNGSFLIHRYDPNPAHRAVYDATYAIYTSLYPALVPAFKALAELPKIGDPVQEPTTR